MTRQSGPSTGPTQQAEPTVEEFAATILAATLGAQQIQAIYLGERLGWYRTLAEEGPLTSAELARRTGTNARYAREWLEHQAVSGYLKVDDDPDAGTRAYRLPAAHAEVLVDHDSLSYLSPLARLQVAAGTRMTGLLHAYRHGDGVSWEDFGEDAREAQATMNRPMFLQQLGQEFLPLIPDLHQRLLTGARVADLGCGEGWSSIGIALSYPEVEVEGFDVDSASIEAARRHAAAHDVQDRVRFSVLDAALPEAGSLPGAGFDASFAFECVHDVPDPVGFLSTLRRCVRPGAPVIVLDERTAARFDPDAGAGEQLLYGFSLTICLPDGMSHRPSAETGTVMRPSVLTGYARLAGFERVEELPIEHDMFRFYRLHG